MKQLEQLFVRGSVNVGDNGAGAKSAPVRIVANVGDPFPYPVSQKVNHGMLVVDFDTMKVAKKKLPFNWEHSAGSVGYGNNYAVENGELVIKGAIIPDISDEGEGIINDLKAGKRKLQASVESFHADIIDVPAGQSVFVNGRTIQGPVNVARNWTLDAVAICEEGRDSGTSVCLAASKAEKYAQAQKVAASNTSKQVTGESKMDSKEQTAPAAVDAATEVKTDVVAEVAPVADEKAKVETVEPVVEAVDAEKKAEAEAPAEVKVEKPEVVEPVAIAASPAIDGRAEFKLFCSTFGTEKAAQYYADGLSLVDAQKAHHADVVAENAALKTQIAELTTRITASKSGGAAPISFGDSTAPTKRPTINDLATKLTKGVK